MRIKPFAHVIIVGLILTITSALIGCEKSPSRQEDAPTIGYVAVSNAGNASTWLLSDPCMVGKSLGFTAIRQTLGELAEIRCWRRIESAIFIDHYAAVPINEEDGRYRIDYSSEKHAEADFTLMPNRSWPQIPRAEASKSAEHATTAAPPTVTSNEEKTRDARVSLAMLGESLKYPRGALFDQVQKMYPSIHCTENELQGAKMCRLPWDSSLPPVLVGPTAKPLCAPHTEISLAFEGGKLENLGCDLLNESAEPFADELTQRYGKPVVRDASVVSMKTLLMTWRTAEDEITLAVNGGNNLKGEPQNNAYVSVTAAKQ